jgi:hypothetical protein
MRIPIGVAAFFLALCLSSPAHAAQTADQAASRLDGTVISTGNLSIVVQADDGRQKAFVVLNTTMLPPQQIAAGDRVLVRYRPLDASHAEALGIDVVQPGATSEPGPSLQ